MLGEGLLHKAAERSPGLTSGAGSAVTPSPASLRDARLGCAEGQLGFWECCLSNEGSGVGCSGPALPGHQGREGKEGSMAPEAMASAESAGSSQGKLLFFVIKNITVRTGTWVNHKCHPICSSCLDEIQNKACLSAPSLQSPLRTGLYIPADRSSTKCPEKQRIELSCFLFLAGKPPVQTGECPPDRVQPGCPCGWLCW